MITVGRLSLVLLLISSFLFAPLPFLILLSFFTFLYDFENENLEKTLVISISIILIFYFSLVSLSLSVESDFLTYKNYFQGVINNSDTSLSLSVELGFSLITGVLANIFNEDFLVYFSFVLIVNSLIFSLLYRIHFRLALLAFIVIQFYSAIIAVPFILRQSLSTYLVIISVLSTLRFYKYLIFIMSISIHMSSLLYFITIFKKVKLTFTSNKLLCTLLLGIFSSFFINIEFVREFADNIRDYSVLSAIFFKLTYFFKAIEEKEVASLYYIFTAFLFCTLIISVVRNGYQINEIDLLFFISAILLIAFRDVPVLYNRAGFLFYYFSPIGIYSLIYSRGVKFFSLPEKFIISFLLLVVFYYFTLRFIAILGGTSWVLILDGDFFSFTLLGLINFIFV